jgi:enterochelin esterase family protein
LKKDNFYPSVSVNCAIQETSVSFEPQLPLGKAVKTILQAKDDYLLPPGVMLLGEGKIRLNFAAGSASDVIATIHNREYELCKGEEGIWSSEIDSGSGGFCPVTFFVDGVEVLNPLAPICFGSSRPINYVEIPQEGNNFFWYKDVPHGSVTQEYYYSNVTGCHKSCLVYTPPGYMKETKGEYPVLYLQHGHGENERCWIHQGKANFIMDNLIAEKKAIPCIIVMNNGMVQADSDGLRELDIMKLEGMLLEDCIPFIEQTYRVQKDKWSRAMAGLSMGSIQTSAVTLKHADLFGYAGIFSGFVKPFGPFDDEGSYLKILGNKEEFESGFKLFFRAVGDLDSVTLDRFRKDSLLFAENGLSPENCRVHIEKIYPGGHEWNVWRMCLQDFAQIIFKA